MYKRGFDVQTVIGYIGVFGAIFGGLFIAGGTLHNIWDLAGFVFAFGGATGGILVSLVGTDLKKAAKVFSKAFVYETLNEEALISEIVRYATVCRKDGLLALEKEITRAEDLFLAKSLQYAVDGTSPEMLETLLNLEIEELETRHNDGRRIFEIMATYCPAFGMLGTIIGLCLTLAHLEDPQEVGPKMAVALLTTFYGIFGCYGLFTPLAKKLEKRSKDEIFFRRIIIKGMVSIQSGDAPRLVESKLRSFLSTQKSKIT